MSFDLNIRTAEQIEADALHALRAGSTLTRREFCLVLATAGVLQPEDAIAAAKGEWPTVMGGFLSFLDPDQSTDAQIEWAATGSIERLHPFVLSLASWVGLSDQHLDDLFGIAASVADDFADDEH